MDLDHQTCLLLFLNYIVVVFCLRRFVDQVVSKRSKDKVSKPPVLVGLLVLLNVGLIIVDRILLGLYRTWFIQGLQ